MDGAKGTIAAEDGENLMQRHEGPEAERGGSEREKTHAEARRRGEGEISCNAGTFGGVYVGGRTGLLGACANKSIIPQKQSSHLSTHVPFPPGK